AGALPGRNIFVEWPVLLLSSRSARARAMLGQWRDGRPPPSQRRQASAHAVSLDGLGGRQQGLRHSEAERSGGPLIDYQLEFGRLDDRQFGRGGATENLPGIVAGLPVGLDEARPIAH